MTADQQDDIFARYIVARFALWAGDFNYFQDQVRKIAPRHEFGKMPDSMDGPEDMVRYVAVLCFTTFWTFLYELTAAAWSRPQFELFPDP